MRLIDADALIAEYDRVHVGQPGKARKLIEDASTIEPRKGKWIPHREKSREYIGTVLIAVTYDYWLCDACGYRVKNGQPMYNFCPNCGVDMRYER